MLAEPLAAGVTVLAGAVELAVLLEAVLEEVVLFLLSVAVLLEAELPVLVERFTWLDEDPVGVEALEEELVL